MNEDYGCRQVFSYKHEDGELLGMIITQVKVSLWTD